MKKYVLAALVTLCMIGFTVPVFAGSCALTSTEKLTISSTAHRYYVTLTCTGDGSITAYTLTPSTLGIRGWYLYNVTTNPGTNAPTDLYDITLVSDGEDIAGGLLANRSTSATQTVALSPTGQGLHMADQAIAVTFANETANPSTIVMTLRFTDN